jgi:hypothetical protein
MSILKFSSILITGLLISTTIAQARPDSRYMSCGQAKSLVQSSGAIILSTGAHTYDKYVKNHAYCNLSQELKRAFVPTSDQRRCNIGYRCKERIWD